MLIFNCSKAAANFLTVTRKGEKQTCVEAPPCKDLEEDWQHLGDQLGEGETLFQWVLHATRIQHKHCLVAMSVEHRYAMVFTNMKKGDTEGFISLFLQRLLLNMLSYGLNSQMLEEHDLDAMTERFMSEHQRFCFFLRSQRSVQTHINDVLWHLRTASTEMGELPDNQFTAPEFDVYVNDTLRRVGSKGDYFYPDVNMFTHWSQRYCAIEPQEPMAVEQRFRQWRRERHKILIAEALPERLEPSVLRPRPVPNTKADNVISLDEFRARRSRH